MTWHDIVVQCPMPSPMSLFDHMITDPFWSGACCNNPTLGKFRPATKKKHCATKLRNREVKMGYQTFIFKEWLTMSKSVRAPTSNIIYRNIFPMSLVRKELYCDKLFIPRDLPDTLYQTSVWIRWKIQHGQAVTSTNLTNLPVHCPQLTPK